MPLTQIEILKHLQVIEFLVAGRPTDIVNGRVTIYIKNGKAYRTQKVDDPIDNKNKKR